MPNIITATQFATRFAFDIAVKQYKFTDLTNYGAASIPLTGVRSNFTIVSPSGVTVYNNTSFGAGSDIITNVSTTNSTILPLSYLANGTPEQGTYVITMTTQINDGVNALYTIITTNTYILAYSQPIPCISSQVDCISPLFVTNDVTNYTVNSVTPVITRTFTLQFPTGSSLSTITNTTTAVIVTAGFASGQQIAAINSALTYTFAPGFTVTDIVTGSLTTNVDCSDICQVHCCIVSLDNQVEAARGVDDRKFQNLLFVENQVMNKLGLLLNSVACGKQVDASKYMAQIRNLSDCQSDCTCTDGAPRLITGLAGLNNVNVVVQGANSAITVTPVIAGGITTYTIAMSPSLLSTITNSYNTVVASGTNTSVTSVSSAGVTTYTVNANVSAGLKDSMTFRAQIAYSDPATPTVVITAPQTGTLEIDGTNFISPTIASVGFGGGSWATSPNLFLLSAFQTVPDNLYKCFAQMALLSETILGTIVIPSGSIYLTSETCRLRLLNQVTAGEIYFQFIDQNGIPISNTGMTYFTNIILNFELKK